MIHQGCFTGRRVSFISRLKQLTTIVIWSEGISFVRVYSCGFWLSLLLGCSSCGTCGVVLRSMKLLSSVRCQQLSGSSEPIVISLPGCKPASSPPFWWLRSRRDGGILCMPRRLKGRGVDFFLQEPHATVAAQQQLFHRSLTQLADETARRELRGPMEEVTEMGEVGADTFVAAVQVV